MTLSGCPAAWDTRVKAKIKSNFGASLSQIRNAKGRTQEDFSNVSSRTYISMLERGIRSPTLDKVEELASELRVHPLTLLSLAYVKTTDTSVLLEHVKEELRSLGSVSKKSAPIKTRRPSADRASRSKKRES